MPTRLIDLHVDWLLQYVPDSLAFDANCYPGIQGRLGQIASYLQTTRAAILSCFRTDADWAGHADPWAALIQLIARIEAEFPGRLLIGPDDFDRWEDDGNGFTWGLIGIEGFDRLVRNTADLEYLPKLFERGVRLFQPVYTTSSFLGGSSSPGDDRTLTPLGTEFLDMLLSVAPTGAGPRPLLDLAHLNPTTTSAVLDWFEADSTRGDRLVPVYSHGTPVHDGFDSPRALPVDQLRRLRSLGGFIGISISPPFFNSVAEIQAVVEQVATIPWRGKPGFAGLGIGTDFLGVDQTLPQLGNAEEVVHWFSARFSKSVAMALLNDNARALMARVTGAIDLTGDPTADLAGSSQKAL